MLPNDFLLASAVAFANNATAIFNMFITVLFSSFAFAAALPLRDIGNRVIVGPWTLSASSIVMGLTLAAFYFISILSFYKSATSAELLLGTIDFENCCGDSSQKVMDVFKKNSPMMPLIGYFIGSVCGLIIFLWVTNVERVKKSKVGKPQQGQSK